MASNHLSDIFEAHVSEAQVYLQKSDLLASITLPEISPHGNLSSHKQKFSHGGGSNDGPSKGLSQPYSAAGTLAVTGLAASLLNILVPINVNWFENRLPAELEALLEDAVLAEAREKLGDLADLMRSIMDEHQLRPQIHSVLNRIIIEPAVMLHVNEDRMRVIPMRNFIVQWYNGAPAFAVICENNPDAEDILNPDKLYTYIDWRKGEIWQQTTSQQRKKKINGVDPKQYILVTTDIPVAGDNYTYSLGMRHYGSIYAINHLAKSLQAASAIASKDLLFVEPGGDIRPSHIERAEPGQILSGSTDGIKWLTSAQKINDWSFVAQHMEMLKQELGKAFALGLMSQPDIISQEKTATEISRIGSELDAAIGAHAQTLANTLLKPLAEAYLIIAARRRPDLLKEIEPIVIAGTTAIAEQIQIQQLWQWTSLFIGDPEFRQSLNLLELYKRGADALNLPTEGLIRSAEEVQAQQQQQQMQQEQAQLRDSQLAQLRQQDINQQAGPIA